MTRVLVFRFRVDLEEKFVLGKREVFEAGEKDYHNVHCAVTVAMWGSKSLEHNNWASSMARPGRAKSHKQLCTLIQEQYQRLLWTIQS
jgi:hypothetical protein